MRRRALDVAVGAAAIGLGLASEYVAFGWDRPLLWLPDLAVGLAFVAAGLVAWPRQRGVGTLLALTGFAWFAGNLAAAALYWHRGPLVHLLVAYPGWRPRARVALAATAIGYAAAIGPVWREELAALTLPALLVAVVALEYVRSAGSARHRRRTALRASVALAAVLAGGAVARLAMPSGAAVVPALLAYEAALIVVALALAWALRWTPTGDVTDLVVELGAARSGGLRDELARVLGDPRLRVGYWSPEAGGYADANGEPVAVPEPGGTRSATLVGRDGEPFAVLVHDQAILEDPALVEAVAAATRLTISHTQLRDEVVARVSELAASRRRLLVAADEARRELERRLRGGPERRLQRLHESLTAVASRRPHLARADEELAGTLADLRNLARGLHPRELAGGLAVALAGLAERSPIPVRLSVSNERLPSEVETAAWYTCAEAVTNAAKHAAASSVTIEVRRRDDRLTIRVTDDGRGGADPSRGTGLRGLTDRLEALGGRLTVDSDPGAGTRLIAEMPLTA